MQNFDLIGIIGKGLEWINVHEVLGVKFRLERVAHNRKKAINKHEVLGVKFRFEKVARDREVV